MKANRMFLFLAMAMTLFIASCSNHENPLPPPVQPSEAAALQQLAMRDGFVSSELIPLSDGETPPLALRDQVAVGSAIKVFNIKKRISGVETFSHTESLNDSTALVTITRKTTGSLILSASFNADATKPDTVLTKPLEETFSRNVLFLLKPNGDKFEATGTVADLSKDCVTGSGSFSLVHNGTSTLIFFAHTTEFDDVSCSSLNNGDTVQVESRQQMTGANNQQGWLASEIEREDKLQDDDHEIKFKKAALSLLEGGTATKSARITELRVFFSNNDSVIVTSPLEFYFFFEKKFHHAMRVINKSDIVRVAVVVESSKADPEVVLLRRGNAAEGKVSLKRQLQLISETNTGAAFRRVFEITLPAHGIQGYFHSVVEVWTKESIYDDQAAVSTHSWGIPYVVH
ncbi:MAG: hypothetical protein HY276_11305 [Ignavibacteriales bacterium]|nr:hypothetical protein [Ignavibacteriales bacterium]